MNSVVFLSGSGSTASLQPIKFSLIKAARTMTFVSLKNLHFVFARSFVNASITLVVLNILLIFTKNFFGRHMVASKCCFCAPCKTDKCHFLGSWAPSQIQHSTLLHTWASRTMCLVSGSKSLHPISPWQKWRLCVSRSPISDSTGKQLHVSKSSFKFSSSIHLNNCVTSRFLVSDALCALCTFCVCYRKG